MLKNTKTIFLFIVVVSISLLVGCGGGGGGSSSYYYEDDDYITDSSKYYDSTKSNVGNLARLNQYFSAYNGKNSIEIRNIPVDASKEVLYACLITNPNNTQITDLTLVPPLAGDYRASQKDENEEENERPLQSLSDSSSIKEAYGYDENCSPTLLAIPFRENLSLKAKLKEELYNKYLENEKNNKNLFLRANVSHQNEFEGQRDINITVLSKSRRCTLAKVSTYGKFFIDQDGDGSVFAPNIADSSLSQLAEEFDNYVYPILKDNFGNGSDIFWRDVDNDGKLSIVFSPVVNNYGKSVVGIFDTASINSSNPRDMISIAVKSGDKSTYEKWFMDARETIPHEMQHIVNFSAKSGRSEELWIDEGLAVCAEILYRIKRSQMGLTTYSLYYGDECLDFPGNDARFYYAAYFKPELSLTSFETSNDSIALAHYGQKGLFFYYLYEQYGQEQLRQLCQGPRGTDKFNQLDRSLEQLSLDFNFAVLNEKIRGIELTNYAVNPYDIADKKYKFITDLNLKFDRVQNGSFISVDKYYVEKHFNDLNKEMKINMLTDSKGYIYPIPANGGTVRLFLKQPKGFNSRLAGSTIYTISFTSSKPVVINMMRISE